MMGLLMKVTSQPLEIVRMSEGGKLVLADDLKTEQRRLLARRMVFGIRYGNTSSNRSISMKDRSDIRRAFASGSGRQPILSKYPGVKNSKEESASSDYGSESFSRYQTERGAFELRVRRGELTFVPPLVMTIITQYPDVQFEYTGGFHYVPPRETSNGAYLDLTG